MASSTSKTSKVSFHPLLSAYLPNSHKINIHACLIIIIIHVSMETYLFFIFDSLSFTFQQILIIVYKKMHNDVWKGYRMGLQQTLKCSPKELFHRFRVKMALQCIQQHLNVRVYECMCHHLHIHLYCWSICWAKCCMCILWHWEYYSLVLHELYSLK